LDTDAPDGASGDVLRWMFERVVEACIAASLVGGEGFAVDASLL
jgi:transposase